MEQRGELREGERKIDEKPPGLEDEERAHEAHEEERRAQEAREDEERREQEAREEARAQEAPELRRSETEVSAQEERTEQEREVEAQRGQEEDVNSVHDECHVSNRHMTQWHNAWWIRVDNGPHMRSARGRRRTCQAARQAAEQVRDGNRVRETWREERERLKKGERGKKGSTERTMRPPYTLSYTSHKHNNSTSNNTCSSNSSGNSFSPIASEIVLQPLHPEAGASLHNEHTIAVVDGPWSCDVVDVSAGPV